MLTYLHTLIEGVIHIGVGITVKLCVNNIEYIRLN